MAVRAEKNPKNRPHDPVAKSLGRAVPRTPLHQQFFFSARVRHSAALLRNKRQEDEMKVFTAAIIGIIAANAGFGAGLVGTILVGPLTGAAYSAVSVGFAIGAIAMLAAFVLALRSLGRLRYAILLSH